MPDQAGVTVALDGFGAEQGFDVLAEGARLAAADGIVVRVFGPPAELSLDDAAGIEVIATSEWVTNQDDPVRAVRSRDGASIVRAAADVAGGGSDALASVGATGAAMAAATFGLRRLHGVQRPALAVRVPVPGKPVLFLDVGANVVVRPQHLVQFAFLGAAFSEAVLGVERPRVGLLSVGEEAGKGSSDVVTAHDLLSKARGIDFIGNVEGRDIPEGAADVVVTDGFTGNISLKLMEGTARTVTGAIRDAARSNPMAAAGGLLMRQALSEVRRELDPDTTGGAILLGLRRIAVVGHGSSGPEGVANVIRLAARSVEVRAIELTSALLEQGGATRGALAEEGAGVIEKSGMTREEVTALVREHLADELEVDVGRITEGSRFKEDLDADSLDLYELVMELEDRYGVSVPEEDAARIKTVGDAVDFVLQHAPA